MLGGLATILAYRVRVDPGDGIVRESAERIIGLIGEDVAVGEEKDARAACRFPG